MKSGTVAVIIFSGFFLAAAAYAVFRRREEEEDEIRREESPSHLPQPSPSPSQLLSGDEERRVIDRYPGMVRPGHMLRSGPKDLRPVSHLLPPQKVLRTHYYSYSLPRQPTIFISVFAIGPGPFGGSRRPLPFHLFRPLGRPTKRCAHYYTIRSTLTRADYGN